MTLSLTYRGFNYVDYYNGEYGQNDTLPQVAATGADSVALTPDFGIDVATSSVYAGGDSTDTVANLQTAIQDATAQGMSVFIRPLVDILYPQVSPNNGAPNYYVPNSFTGDVGVTGAGNTATTYNPATDTQYNGDLPSTNPATVASTVPAGTSTSDLVNYRGELETTDEPGGDLNAAKFFSSYDTLMVNEAKMAEAALPAGGSALFSIGTELDSLATDPALTSDWDTLIADIRTAAPDLKLTYSANWSSAAEVTFWNKLDYVALDAYVPLDGAQNLTATNNPSVATLEQGWNTVSSVPIPYSDETVSQALLQELQDGTAANGQAYLSGTAAAPTAIDAFDLLAEKAGTTTGKLIFSEIGYQNDTSAAFDPTGSSNQGTLDPQLQANLYSALFGAWGAAQQTANGNGGNVDGIPFALVGAYLWDWNPDTSAASYDDWSPDGYPAETVINSNFATTNPITVVAETGEASEGGHEGVPTAARGNALTGDTDANSATLSISAIQGGTVGQSFATKYGSITLDANGTYAYFTNSASLSGAPTGSAPTDTITFTVGDTNGATNTGTLTITDYRNPTAVVSETGAVVAGQTLTATAGTTGTGALAGASDPDGASLAVQVLSDLGIPESGPVAGNYGTLTLNADGSYSYVADSSAALASAFAADHGAPLTDGFLLIVEGPFTAFAQSSLAITVTEANPITVVAETGQASQGGGPAGAATDASGNALTGDTDANGATLSITAIDGGTVGQSFATKYGSITLDANGSYTYAVGAALAGAPDGSAPTDTISFTVGDSNGASTTGTLTVTDYRDPSVVAETGSVEEGQIVTGTAGTTGTGALAGDSDPDGASLNVAVVNSPGGPLAGNYGTLTFLNGDGSYSYIADTAAQLASAFAADNGAPLTDTFALSVNGPLTASTQSSLTITITEAPAPGASVQQDFYNNGASAIPIQNTDGQIYFLQEAGAGGNVGNYGSDWSMVGADSFYTDGNTDILLQNTDGQMYLLDMQGSNAVGGGNVGNFGSAWDVVSTGGFFSDGDQGIALQNTDGQIYLLDLQGNNVVGSGVNIGNYGSDWHVAATGDFFGDGNDDLVLQNTDGDIYLFDIHDTVVNSGNVGNFGADWKVVGTGSFLGDGNTDLVLQDTDGQIGLLDVHNSTVVGFTDVGNFGADWQVKEVGDFFGDGHSGIALQNTDGQMFLMELNGGTVTQSANLGNYGTSWHVPFLPG